MIDFDIIPAKPSDLHFIYQMFEDAIAYQQRNSYPVWRGYDKPVLERDIKDQLLLKITAGDEIAYIFSICYSDKIIWREMDREDALYLHRMVVNPRFKGQRLFQKALDWSRQHARTRDLPFVRMDTWADNSNIISYYKSYGFKVVDYFQTPDSVELPIQQRKNDVVLLEIPTFPS